MVSFSLPITVPQLPFSLPKLSFQHNVTWQMVGMAALATISTSLCGMFGYHYYLSYTRRGEVPICWSWVPILGYAIEFGDKPVEFMLQKSKQIKDEIFGVVLAGERIFFINDSDSYSAIFKADKKQFSFDVFADQVTVNVFGVTPSACTRANDANLNIEARQGYQKHLLQDSGCAELTSRMLDKMVSMAEELKMRFEQRPAEQTFNMLDFTNDFVYRASAAALFNSVIADDKDVFNAFMSFDSVFSLALAGMPVYSDLTAMISRDSPAACRDRVIDCLMRVVDDSGPFISSRVSMYRGINLGERDTARYQFAQLWASTGNTMPGCYWTLYFILINPDARRAVEEELRSVLGDRAPSADLRVEAADLQHLVVLDSCISEALRLMSGSMIMRQVVAKEGGTLTLNSGKSYRFRHGDKVGIFPSLTHFNEDFYPDASAFKYDRFLSPDHSEPVTSFPRASTGTQTPLNSCFMPFGAGAHYCPGRKFARNEIKVVVGYLLANFNITLVDAAAAAKACYNYDGSRAGLGVFPPKRGLEVKIAPRW